MEKLKKKAVSLEAFVCLIVLIGSCVSAVSYTHLDVYKRQRKSIAKICP